MDIKQLKHDRMRFTKNKASANLAYLAILFNVLYFVSIYSSDVGNNYYNIKVGLSVIYNLLFLLTAFLSSEGLKAYRLPYAIIITVIGALQLVRILGYPLGGYKTVLDTGARVMEMKQLIYTVVMLSLSSVSAIASGVVGIIRTLALARYNRSLTESAK